jgi:hypothetical protein
MLILGRDAELASIDTWLNDAARSEPLATTEPSLLIIEGAPGIGKTTLWAEAIRRAQALGRRVLSCRPVPSDAGLPHVGIADLLREIPDHAFSQLPAPQQRALGVALLREDAGASPPTTVSRPTTSRPSSDSAISSAPSAWCGGSRRAPQRCRGRGSALPPHGAADC